MSKVSFGGQSYECGEDSILDCLTAQGVPVPSSCRSGVCQTCLMKAVKGEVPEKAKAGLKPTLAAQNYFMACSCYPEQDLEVVLPDAGINRLGAEITGVEYLSKDVLGIKLKPHREVEYRAGQFINLFKDETTARCYSLASVPELDKELMLHVRKVPNGIVSSWVFADLKVGDAVNISEANGDCFYVPGNPDQNILLLATGTGLAPLYGIIRDAIKNGHKGKISLYHGGYNKDGLYLVKELQRLVQLHPNISYTRCVSEGEAPQGYESGTVLDAALTHHPDLSGWRVYLCGNPQMVKAARQQTFFAGASMRDIYADPF